MIQKLKRKFIILSMTSLFILLFVIVAGMNLINYNSICAEADNVLTLLSQNKGTFPEHKPSNTPTFDEIGKHDSFKLPPNMSPETPYESRYFSVVFTDSGKLIQVETSKIAAIDSTTAINYGKIVFEKKKEKGFIDKYRYHYSYSKPTENTIRITFLDCGRNINAFQNFLFASCGMSLAGFIIVFFVISFFAERIIHPIAESYEKQKQFITNAGHEIKTPLTVINANLDLLEFDFGENESFDDIRQQTKRLTTLTNDLVLLSRMEESTDNMTMIDFPISDVITETVESFHTLTQTQNKKFIIHIEPNIALCGNDKSIRQLLTILMDNALKYSPEHSNIYLDLSKQNRTIYFSICNKTKQVLSEEQIKELSRVFERFYRLDTSRNSEMGGYGIGLSIAKAIVLTHGGKIHASAPTKQEFCISIAFPIKNQ